MLVRLAELEIEPALLDAYKTHLSAEIEASVDIEPGVLALQAVALKDMPNHIRLLEVYADPQAYADHLLTPHFLRYKAATSGMVRALRLIEAEPVRLCAKSGFSELSEP